MRDDWVKCSFEDLTSSLKRGPFGGDLKKAFFVPSGYAVYEQQHAINNEFTSLRYFIDDKRYQKLLACNVGPGDYIVSCSGTMGKIARLPDNAPSGVINQALLRIRINDKIITHDYFLHLFRSSLFQSKILKDSRGSGMQNMAGIKELKPVPIYIPPLTTQRAIVAKIEELFSELDKGEEELKKAQGQLNIYRQAVLKKAFEGDWPMVTLQALYEFIGGGTPSKRDPSFWNGNIPWASVKDVKNTFLTGTIDSITERGLENSSSKVAEPGDVIMVTRISPGMSTICKKKIAINQDLKIVKPKTQTLNTFTHYLFKSLKGHMFRLSSGTTVKGITLNNLKAIEVPLIAHEEQITISAEIESRLSVCDSIEGSIRESLDKSKALRQSILKKAFEGTLLSEEEIAACKAAPDYEPASVLLERIKAEKKKN